MIRDPSFKELTILAEPVTLGLGTWT